ncbi:PREDICTED: probable leucine-rich repeat receptor-like protein kinase At5g49770 [Erythranthe guttata]|uniref:probable leucine-rich repeat receptor-like protein kinase At5g49770 n=1 Tax=Erythranthe guttata TaxID=4155 RepID=UPI00064DFC8D|nr:PREDICTED: probable leucine-rich repeat receptor-like protein kinase At5g49770 [Erythranthe guttata]|eukprot:XP_012842358.1 PREDICTED: probable leucine-rich repeat receptor-like protein kinase At5g49770 [Erythranthe guttata]
MLFLICFADVALKALKDTWINVPPNWVGSDPCGDVWDGITCKNDRVVSITLASINLTGQLSSDISGLTELQTLDLSYNKGMTGSLPSGIGNVKKLSSLILVGCGFSGPIPPSIGSLQQLRYLSLNSNNFIGSIPPSIGNLLNLYWLDLADNKLTGTIPVSDGTSPGLDMLVNTKHFHFGKNQLSGVIPPQLFNSNLALIHLLFENNQLTGSIPSTMGLVRTLEVVRLDRNSLSGPVPSNFNNLTSVQELFLANNKLTGSLPNLTGMNLLHYVDMSNNSFDATDIPPWFSSLQSLTTLIMENTKIQGSLPVSLFSLLQLQTVTLKNNQINGTLNIGSNHSNQLQIIDLQNNLIDAFTQRAGFTVQVILVGNPICNEGGQESYCTIPQPSNNSYSTPPQNCMPSNCSSETVSSPTCKCAYPYTGTLIFRAPSFSNYRNGTIFVSLENKLMSVFKSRSLPVDSVSVSNPNRNIDNYLSLDLQVFPSGQEFFNRTAISGIGFTLSNQTFKPPPEFGPFFFIGRSYPYFQGISVEGSPSKKSSNTGVIIGAAVGGAVLLLLLIVAGVYAIRQRTRAETADRMNDPFALWDPSKNSGAVPQLKGAKAFTFEELKESTNNFSESNAIGSGGYGRVYRGTLAKGQLVAIKRAVQGSMQGRLEFKTEIELLSRVHHKNVVSLVGFCFDHGEQMLVYEFIANGTLRDSISGKSGIRLDWMRRLRIAHGAAKGIQYLHDEANPPIIHRDIKSNNILLDERLNAKVADFGLSKIMHDSERNHVTTQVKGTMGYLDPEYYMTQQLTEKSDVYSFGILMFELLTARLPIEKNKHIVRQVMSSMDKSKSMYNLQGLLDPAVASRMSTKSVEMFVDLALWCVKELGSNRPSMSEVVKEIENTMEIAGINPNAESTPSSSTYVDANKASKHPYSDESLFAYSGSYLDSSSGFQPK